MDAPATASPGKPSFPVSSPYNLTSNLADASDKAAESCLAWPAATGAGPGPDNFLRRPGLPSKMDIIDLLRPDTK